MKILTSLIAIILVLVLQSMVFGRFALLQQADLFLLLNMYYALHFAPIPCIAMALISGVIQDSFSQGILGMNAFSKTVIAYVFSTISSRLMLKHPFIIMLLVGIATVLDFVIIQGLFRLFSLSGWTPTWKTILTSCILNMVVGFMGFQTADRFRMKKEYV